MSSYRYVITAWESRPKKKESSRCLLRLIRASATATRRLGIQLALVKRLVEMHDGEVSAGAEPDGQGSEFLVRLPLMTVPKANELLTSFTQLLRKERCCNTDNPGGSMTTETHRNSLYAGLN